MPVVMQGFCWDPSITSACYIGPGASYGVGVSIIMTEVVATLLAAQLGLIMQVVAPAGGTACVHLQRLACPRSLKGQFVR